MKISPTFDLPIEAVSDSSAILAKKGAGKSNAAVVMAEEMYAAGVPFVTIDPKGDHWGIRSSADGKKPGLAVPVFGGRHGDMPLEATAGALLADVILGDDKRGYLTCVLDVSQFTMGEQRRFLQDFGQRLFRAKDEQGVLHLFLEEAHEYLPQQVGRDAAPLVSTWQRIVKQGRFKGLGVTVISQRSAALNKDVLTQVDSLYVLRTLSPQDRAAVKAWLDVHIGGTEVIKTLHELKNGEAWLWSPDRFHDPVRFRFRQRWTFDSGATPVFGAKSMPPATMADLDLGEIKDQMADTIERSKADDPKELRKQINALRRQLTELEKAKPDPERVEVEVRVEVERVPQGALAAARVIAESSSALVAALEQQDGVERLPVPKPLPKPATKVQRAVSPRPLESVPALDALALKVGKAHRRVLIVLARFPDGRVKRQIAAMAQLKSTGGHFGNVLSQLRTQGLIVGSGDGPYRITDAGLTALGDDYEPLPTGDALLDWWLNQLGRSERAILLVCVEAWPDAVDRSALAEAVGVDASGGHYGNLLSSLRTRDLITGSGELTAHPDFMAAVQS